MGNAKYFTSLTNNRDITLLLISITIVLNHLSNTFSHIKILVIYSQKSLLSHLFVK